MNALHLCLLLCTAVVSTGAAGMIDPPHRRGNLRRKLLRPVCPVSEPTPGDMCTEEGTRCGYGSETCCGVTHASFVCECANGAFRCLNTDACLHPQCDEGNRNLDSESSDDNSSDESSEEDSSSFDGSSSEDSSSEDDSSSSDQSSSDDNGATNSPFCPATTPGFGDQCTIQSLRCEYGSLTCCGETTPSQACTCSGGQFACVFIDRCIAGCDQV